MRIKKTAAALISAALLLTGCSGAGTRAEPDGAADPAVPEESAEVQWTEDRLNSTFLSKNEAEKILASVPASDGAYGLVGVVMFTDRESENLRLAFMDKNGHCQFCGLEAPPYSPPELQYLGDGEVIFRFSDETGEAQDCVVSFSRNGSDVHFKSETPIYEDGE